MMTPAAHTLVAMIHEVEDLNYQAGRATVHRDDTERAIAQVQESRKRLFAFLPLMTEEDLKSLR